MDYKKITMIALMAMVLVIFSGLVSAGSIAINLTSGGTFSNNITIGVEMSSAAGTENATEPVLYGSASDTNTTTAARLYNGSPAVCNINGTISGCNFSFRTNATEDSVNWAFYVIARNGTNGGGAYTSPSVTVTIDNTKPKLPSSLLPSADTIDEDGNVGFGCNITKNVTTRGYIQFKTKNPGSSKYSTTETTNGSLTITLKDIPQGVYEWRYVATDGTQENATSYRTLTVKNPRMSGKAAYVQQITEEQEEQKIDRGYLVIIAAVVVIILLKVNKKKK